MSAAPPSNDCWACSDIKGSKPPPRYSKGHTGMTKEQRNELADVIIEAERFLVVARAALKDADANAVRAEDKQHKIIFYTPTPKRIGHLRHAAVCLRYKLIAVTP